MNALLTKHYLRLALVAALSAAVLWVLVVLFGFTSYEASGPDATAAALGLAICFLAAFLSVVLFCGLYDVWRGTRAELALETALWAAPVQRERAGFVLMAGSLLLLVHAATGSIAQAAWPALSGILLFGGGLVLVGSALRDDVSPRRPFHRHVQAQRARQQKAAQARAKQKKHSPEDGDAARPSQRPSDEET